MIRNVLLTAIFAAALTCAADAVLPVPGNLTAEGIPAIPSSLYDTLAAYNEYRAAGLQDWNPVRREMLISTRFGQTPQIHRVTTPGGARTQLTFFPERVADAHYEPVTGDLFVYQKDTGGGEWYQLYVYNTHTGRSTLLTDGKSRNTGPVWSWDGKHIAYTSTQRNGRDTDIWLVDPRNPASNRMLFQADSGGWSVEDWSHDGARMLVERYVSANESALFLLDVVSGKSEALAQRPGVSYSGAQFSPDDRSIYLLTNQDSDFRRLAQMDPASHALKFLRPDLHWDIEGLDLSTDGRRLAYVVNEAGISSVDVLDPHTGANIRIPALPPGNVSGARWRPKTHELGVTLTSARIPGDVFSIDVDNGREDRWTMSETGGLDASHFVEAELIRWRSFDGTSISGFYYKPPARFEGRRPVIINIHGGPEGQSQPGYLGSNNYYLEELGVALIFPNVRGSAGYGKAFLDMDNGYKREDTIKDIGALLDWIAARPDLDSSRVMVMGGSYGGYMTLASMTHFNDRLRCAVDVVGISNWISFLEHTEAYRRDLRRAEYGDERDPKMHAFLESISPLTSVHNITKPMFVVAGRNDPRVPWTEGRQMVEGIRQSGTPVWFLVAADEGHGFVKKNNRDYQFAATVMFVKQYLLDQPAAPAGMH